MCFFLVFLLSRRRVPRDDVDAGFFYCFFIDPVSIGDGALDARTSPVETGCVCVRHGHERCDVFPRAGPRECMHVRGDVAWIRVVERDRTPRLATYARSVRRSTVRTENGRPRTDGPHEQHALRMHG